MARATIDTDILTEEVRNVVGYEGWYSISNIGVVRREREYRSTAVGRKVVPHTSRFGYLSVSLSRGGKSKTTNVHSMVAAAFLGPRPKDAQINHKNGIKSDNRVVNLEYCTASQNSLHAIHVLKVLKPRGEQIGCSKLTAEDIRKMRRVRGRGVRLATIAKMFGVHIMTVSDCLRGKTWRHV